MQAVLPPDRLWAWCPGVYHDEQGHVWVAVLRKDPKTGILWARVRAEQVPLGDSWTRSQFPLSPLPHLWQWCPRGLYRAAGGTGEDEWWLKSHQVVSGVPEILLCQLPR
nr:protein p13 MTCP-1-like [Pelodiscus sinensis]|eukprot:XP_025037167.1 protein p13 MTCP-1-like [Pelodiscus sinensis]